MAATIFGLTPEEIATPAIGPSTEPGSRSLWLRLAGPLAVVALAGFLIGEQFTLSAARPVSPAAVGRSDVAPQRTGPAPGAAAAVGGDAAALRQAQADGIDLDLDLDLDLDKVIDGVRHHIAPDVGTPGTLTVEDDGYRATFDDHGFRVGEPGGESWFALSLTGVARDGRALPSQVGRWVGEANVASRPVTGGVTEQVTARKGALEWDVVLSSPPPGSGAVRVEATVTGGKPERIGDEWRWPRENGGGHIDMGELVVVDAAGAELYRALPTVDGDRVTLDVPGAVLDGASYPVTIDPELGPEHPVAPTPVLRPDTAGVMGVAFDGSNYLVLLWSVIAPSGIGAVRMDRSGRLLDLVPIPVLSGSTGPVDVAFDGTNYLVVWATNSESEAFRDIRGTRVSPAGEVLDEGGFPITVGGPVDFAPAVEFDGTNYLVTWDQGGCCEPKTLAAIRVNPQGQVIDPAPKTFVGAEEAQLEFGGTDHLAVWSAYGRVQAARLGPDGTLLTPGIINLPSGQSLQGSDVAFDGENWQVIWAEDRGPGHGFDVVGARVSLTGTVLDQTPFPIAATEADETWPHATPGGERVLVTWKDSRGDGDVYGALVTRSGTIVNPSPIPVATGPDRQEAGPLATGGDQVLATVTGPESGACCYAQAVRMTQAGVVLDPWPLLLSYRISSQWGPSGIAFDGTNYLIAWYENRNGAGWPPEVYAARVSQSGFSLDPTGIRIGSGFAGDVAFDGQNFVIALERLGDDGDYDLYAALLSPDGPLLTPTPVPVAVGTTTRDLGAQLSSDGNNTVVFWARSERPFWAPTGGSIMAARFSHAGEVLDPGGVSVSPGETRVGFPAAAFDGTNHLIVYPRGMTDPWEPGDDIVARRVTPSLDVLDANPLPIAPPPGLKRAPDIAWGGSNYLVVWQSDDPVYGSGVEATRVSRQGTVLEPGPVPISDLEGTQVEPKVASLNGWFLVTWRREREANAFDVMGARIHENGAMPDPQGFLIADDAFQPQVATGSDGRWRTTYLSLDDPAARENNRMFLRTVAPK